MFLTAATTLTSQTTLAFLMDMTISIPPNMSILLGPALSIFFVRDFPAGFLRVSSSLSLLDCGAREVENLRLSGLLLRVLSFTFATRR